jgi:uncharacterized protein (TIGR02145 family)
VNAEKLKSKQNLTFQIMKNIFKISLLIMSIFLLHSCKKDTDNSIKDGAGNIYTSVKIGTQVWLVENLKTTRYRNGDYIGTTDPDVLAISGESAPKYQWEYSGPNDNADTYGRLYTWYAVTDSRNVCPTGWHVPTDAEWTILTTFLGGEDIAGCKLKETGTVHWTSPNTGSTNETGFTALAGGTRSEITFGCIGLQGYWWSSSSTEFNPHYAWYRIMTSEYCSVLRDYQYDKYNGFSVRCIKDTI